MPFLLRAAIVGGAAYHVGKRVQQTRDTDYEQEARIAELEQQQAQAAPATAAPAAQEDKVQKLTQLKGLLDQGVLTQAEFDLEKQKILQGM